MDSGDITIPLLVYWCEHTVEFYIHGEKKIKPILHKISLEV
jgi:hypothetical protein